MSSIGGKSLILSRLKTRQLVLMVRLDEARSVSQAAEAAGITQPAASKLLGDLEDSLGVKLFERHARGVQPTWYGEIMVRHARSALAEITRAHEEILALKAGLTGQASIGTVMNPGTNLVPRAVAKLKARFPGIRVSVEMDFSKPLVQRLLEGSLDLAVARILDHDTAGELSFEALAREPHCVIARAGHPLAGKRGLELGDLVRQSWILPPAGSTLRGRLDSLFVGSGLQSPPDFVETTSLPVIVSLLQASDMLVALPEGAVRDYCRSGVLAVLPLDLGVQMDAFGIITRRGHELSPGAKAMLAVLRETAAGLYWREAAGAVPGEG